MNIITQIQIFVSCTAELSPEKEAIKKICNYVNQSLSEATCNVVFSVRDFKDLIGKFGINPQTYINNSFYDYDIYIGMLWMKFGTPTGETNPINGNPFESGTESEFYIAYESWKNNERSLNIHFFFKEPVPTNTSAAHEQHGKVLKFRDEVIRPLQLDINFDDDDFKDKIYKILNSAAFKLCNDNKLELKNKILSDNLTSYDSNSSKSNINFEEFTAKIEPIEYYIERTVSNAEALAYKKTKFLYALPEALTLIDIVNIESKIVLLGNAGIGKTIEMQQLAMHFLKPETAFIPIYKRFNNYIDEDIERFLPENWDKVSDEILLLIFDGLDEIQPQFYNTAIRKISSFSENNKNIRIVVSCRTNFYDLPSEDTTGTLSGFKCFFLNDISIDDIEKYANNQGIDSNRFIKEINNSEKIKEFIYNPLLLKNLCKFYKESSTLKIDKIIVLENTINTTINLDKEHYKTTIELSERKEEIIGLLGDIALIMEATGRNYLKGHEILRIVKNQENFRLIKYCSIFTKDEEEIGFWRFEHKTIQEYLSSRALKKLSVNNIIKLISFAPDHKKIKPTWINTLSFLVNIDTENSIVTPLLKWLIDADPEIVVKFESERINKQMRIDIFKKIFNSYKYKGIWLSSNKFNYKEFARFGNSFEIQEFLLNEISNKNNLEVIRISALRIIEEFKENLVSRVSIRLKEVLLELILQKSNNPYNTYSYLEAFNELGYNDKKAITLIVDFYSKSKNQYIRSGLYMIINSSIYVNDFVDIFIDGIEMDVTKLNESDRSTVSFWNESLGIETGLSLITSVTSLEKILDLFSDPNNRRQLHYFDKEDILRSILSNCIEAYRVNHSIYNSVLKAFISYGRSSEINNAKLFLNFFDETNTKTNTFSLLWKNNALNKYERQFLLSVIIDKSIVDEVLVEYSHHNYLNEDIIYINNLLMWGHGGTEDSDLFEYFQTKVTELTKLVLAKPTKIDYSKLQNGRNQYSFNLLFDVDAFKQCIINVFKETNKLTIGFSDLIELNKNHQMLEEMHPNSVVKFIRQFMYDNKMVDLDTLIFWIEKDNRFYDYCISDIFDHLKNYQKLIVSENQRFFIEIWCLETFNKTDISNAIYNVRDGGDGFDFNFNAKILLHFIRKFEMSITDEKMLDFTLFDDFENFSERDKNDGVIEYLEKVFGREKVFNRVILNLRNSEKTANRIWENNSKYAIKNQIAASFESIFIEMLRPSRSYHSRSSILRLYYERTNDEVRLMTALKIIGFDDLSWEIISLLLKNIKSEKEDLILYLKDRMNSNDSIKNRLISAQHLINFSDIEGLKFYTSNFLEKKSSINLDYPPRGYSLGKYSQIEALPIFLELLELSLGSEFKQDGFNELERQVLDALHSLAIYSEANLMSVKESITNFQLEKANKSDEVKYLHHFLDRIEQDYYQTKSEQISIDDVISELKLLS